MKRLSVFAALVFFSSHSIPQGFVKTSGSRFIFNGEPFYFFGFNAYYLQSEAAKGKRYIVDETLEAAKQLSVSVIRTWAFYEGNENDSSAIRFSPSGYNERGLQALDYVVYKAKESGIKLILTLANNFNDFGGIAEYIKWAGAYLHGSYSHNDFFKNDSIKAWYKDYISRILNRKNIYTGIAYKEESAIFSFELINEASSGGAYEYASIKEWYEEMSAYFKQINANHLLSTGEIGYDEKTERYHNPDLFYNSEYFLLNGYKGTSFYENSSIKNIDYASFHLYPNGWRIHPGAGAMWIEDHQRIAESFEKPALLGEFGLKQDRTYYRNWLKELIKHGSKSGLVWQYKHPDVVNSDGYGFDVNDEEMKSIFLDFAAMLNDRAQGNNIPSSITLYQNYPNPFNPVTTISYDLPEDDYISLDLYDLLGRRIANLDSGYRPKGKRELTLSFNKFLLSSGVYIYVLRTSKDIQTKKLNLLK